MRPYLLQKLLSARTQFALGTLMLLLQRSPVLRYLAYAKNLQPNAPVARILQSFALPAAALATPHAVSGASTSSYTVEYFNSEIKVGEQTAISFENSITPQSWSLQGTLPPGLRITDLRQKKQMTNQVIATGVGLIVGTPTQAGSYDITLTPWSEDNGTGETAPEPDPGALHLILTVLPSDTATQNPPQLTFTRNDDSVSLQWIHNQSASYELTESSDLKAWSPIADLPTVANGQSSITIPITQIQSRFYRLVPRNE